MEDKNLEKGQQNTKDPNNISKAKQGSQVAHNTKNRNTELLNLSLEKKKEIISQHIIKLSPKLQKALNKLVDFFDEAATKGYDFVSKTQLHSIFPEQYEQLFKTALNSIIELGVVCIIDFKELVINEENEYEIIDNKAYSLSLTPDKMQDVPMKALKQSIIHTVALLSKTYYDPKRLLFSPEKIKNIEAIDRNYFNSAFNSVKDKEDVVELEYYYYQNGKVSRDTGYFMSKFAFEVLNKIGDKFNDIYKGREIKINDAVRKSKAYTIAPETGYKSTYTFSPKEIYYIAEHIIDFSETYGKVYYLMAERALQVYKLVPDKKIEDIETRKESKKENQIIEDIENIALKFFENYKDIISETSLIDTLAQVSSRDRELVKKSLPKLSNKIRKVEFNDKDRTTIYYAYIGSLVTMLRNIKDINIKMEFIRLEVVVSMLEELFERVRINKMELNRLCQLLNISLDAYEDLKKEVNLARNRLVEGRSKRFEKKKNFFERLIDMLFGRESKKSKKSAFVYEKSPEMKEKEFY
ncbi:MAG: hypothetical protein ACOCV8_02815, partial [Spirochaetota bacterium]